MKNLQKLAFFFFFILVITPTLVFGECKCEPEEEEVIDKDQARRYKIAALASILIAGAIGVCIPVLGKTIPALSPDKDIFFLIKAFAAGVILSTGFIHVLPDAFEKLSSDSLPENPWQNFPFTGFIAMLSAIGTLMVDSFATSYYKKLHFNKAQTQNIGDEEKDGEHAGHVHVHTHATHGHSHGAHVDNLGSAELLRHRVIAQAWDLEANFKSRAVAIMGLFFALTTPIGIAIGMGISSGYDEDSKNAMIVEGVFNAASAGILIYMSLVDLLAADFMNPRMQNSSNLQLGANVALLLGAGCMSVLAKWA
ncbi:hypothetical protein FEM48_Zijuj04G0151100 [Ziziphus jujuba var. spinosa]|uniref:Zinc transporter 1-like n=1 Tax=Ziziphus jujuba var. spinosa TaxID=714518 RepID=A0A978VKK2_ZIZJJ|nr:hypothetical protein FEM48_Zijuj04G0151100 [Ziziphus jujuba var. spinosa]